MKSLDAYGKMKLDGGEIIEARVIQITATELAAFPKSDPTVPILIELTGPYQVKGRILKADLIGGGTLEFQRASCGCQTPQNLRGPASRFRALIPQPAEA